jgi:DNA invertase Pin-like site-specific DNA recombinase
MGVSTPAAYIRRSFVETDSPGDISEAAQLATVRKLAAEDGHNGELVIYSDWGVSADIAKSAKRTAYARLLADMEAGTVSAVYAFDVDRLYRDPRDLIRLQDAAQRHRVIITTTSGRLAIGDGDDPAAEGFAFIGAVFGRMELQKSKKRARAALEARRARGDRLGSAPYGWRIAGGELVRRPEEPVERVFEAYRQAGKFGGAARLLNEWGVPTRREGTLWCHGVVADIVRAQGPSDLAAAKLTRRGASPIGGAMFAGLLKCACGAILTPRKDDGAPSGVSGYYCSRSSKTPGHGRMHVPESRMLAWAKIEARRLRIPGDLLESDERDDAAMKRLRERRRRVVEDYEALEFDRSERDQKLALLADEVAKIEARHIITAIPQEVDWTWSPAKINAVLRAMWSAIELNDEMQPLRADWIVPEWRGRV